MLSTEHIQNPNLTKAASELLQNALRLIAAGYFKEAHQALQLLLQPGPWKAGAHGRIAEELERWLPLACHLAGKPSPKIGDEPAMSVAELAEWAKGQEGQVLDTLSMSIRRQNKPAGENWNEAYFQSMLDGADPSARDKMFQDFCADAEFVLKARLAQGANTSPFGADVLGLFSGAPQAMGLLSRLAPIKATDAADNITTDAIARVTAGYLQKSGMPPNYMVDFIFHAATVLGLRKGDLINAGFAASALTKSETGLATLVQSAVWPHLASMLKGGLCAAAVGVDRASAAQYLEALQHRPGAPATVAAKKPRHLVDSPDAFHAALAQSPLAGREIIELPILDTVECAYAIETNGVEMEEVWKIARGLVETTQRWPVLAMCHGDSPLPLKERLLEQDFFSRFYYEEAPDADDLSPRAILAAADSADVEMFLQERMQAHGEELPLDDGTIASELETTQRACGTTPKPEEIARARIDGKPIASHYQLDRWLLDWEAAHGAPFNPDDVRQPWFAEGPVALLFLPTPNPWDALAYLHFYGSSYHGVENYIALGRQWQQRYGAELVAHFGTMLQCYASRPPTTLEDAWRLAVEQDLAAPCTLALPGIALRHHAMGLVDYGRWFLHERP